MKNVAEIYTNGEYASRNPEFGDDNAAWKIKNALKAIDRYDLKTVRIAEVGCAGGAILLAVADACGSEAGAGYEPGPAPYAAARERQTDIVKFFNESVDESTSEHFDLMLCFDVFEHIEDYFSFLRGIKEKSDKFLFHIPLDMNVQMVARATPIQHVRDKVGHLHYYSKDSALASLKHCGYEVEGWFYTAAHESSYNGGVMFKITNLLRRLCFKLSPDLTARLLGGYSLMVSAEKMNFNY